MTDQRPLHDYGRSRAVLIGTWDYTHLTSVAAARHSLNRMYRLLTGPRCGWPEDRVAVLPNEPGPGDLSDRLLDLFEDTTDVALFYYVGHGQIDDEDQLCLGLIGSRTEPHRRATTSLPFTAVRRAMGYSRAATKVVMLDCCFSGLATHRDHALAGSPEEVLERASRTGAYTMTASSADATAWYEADAHAAQPQTYFTKYLADLVDAGVPGQPAGLKLHPLFSQLHDNLARDHRPIPQERSVDAARDFVFAHNAAPPEKIVDPAEELAAVGRKLAEAEARERALQAEVLERIRELQELREQTRLDRAGPEAEQLRTAERRLLGAAAQQGAAHAARQQAAGDLLRGAAERSASAIAGIDIIEHRLPNGLRVLLSEDHNTPVAAVNVWYDAGSRHDPKGRTGLAHLFCMLMFQGSAQVMDNGHFELVQQAGGSLNGTTSFERANYFQTVPAHQLELVLWLEADRMGSLLAAVDDSVLERARDVVRNERRQRYDNVPYGDAFERLVELVYPQGHPYRHTPIGSNADRDAVTLEEARAFFRTYYTPDNTVLSVVGDIDPEQTLAWVEKYFGSIPANHHRPVPRSGALPEDTMAGEQRRHLVEDVPNRALMAAYRMPHDGTRLCDAADLALTVLGGGESSRLHNRLVRRDRLAVSAGFGLLRLVGAPSMAWLDVKAVGDATAGEVEAIDAAVNEELARFAAEGPLPDELERAQAQLEREWLDRLGTVAGRADEFCRYAVLFGDAQLARSALGNLLDITAEEVRDVAAHFLHRENRAVLTYEPLAGGWYQSAGRAEA
ncbi:putative Zn-dependent peptidase [Streptomyces sp. CEV 2-1]|nr:putative Zn-dependent peptidase [Streptomyces sp. CEV 2-1]